MNSGLMGRWVGGSTSGQCELPSGIGLCISSRGISESNEYMHTIPGPATRM